MKLSKLKIQNFRKLKNVEFELSDTTFLIGANNAGKSSTLDAIGVLLGERQLSPDDCTRFFNAETNQDVYEEGETIIQGHFTEVPKEIIEVHGFNIDRLNSYIENGETKYSFDYRIRLCKADNKQIPEMLLHKETLKQQYQECNTWKQLVEAGADVNLFNDLSNDLTKKLTATDKKKLESISELLEVQKEEEWIKNPGGIPGNVLNQLPRYIKIETNAGESEVNEKKGAMYDLLEIMFNDVKEKSSNYKNAVQYLKALSQEMDPSDEKTDFGNLINGLNGVIGTVFPGSSIVVNTDLTSADALKAKYGVQLNSNVSTVASSQGTGMVRSVVFALLKFKKEWEENRAKQSRGLVIGYEEPELFLHPNAAENMRRIIYELSGGMCQIIATTHSPYMIDLSQPNQTLCSYVPGEHDYSEVIPFNHLKAYKQLIEDDKTRLKLLQKIDEYVARVFFAKCSIIVEGNTEDVVFKKTIEVMPEGVRKKVLADYQIIKANGKATMISFSKYLKSLNVNFYVVHDEDANTPGAICMNKPIVDVVGEKNRLMMHNCIEDELGYKDPKKDKPFVAYVKTKDWKKWSDVPENWRKKMKIVFNEFAHLL